MHRIPQFWKTKQMIMMTKALTLELESVNNLKDNEFLFAGPFKACKGNAVKQNKKTEKMGLLVVTLR